MEVAKKLGQISALKMADYILKQYGPMSHLKLQKLLYYCEGYHLAYFEEPVLFESFEAWVHGPVCPDVYHALKGDSILYSDVKYQGSDEIIKQVEGDLTSKQMEVITDVLTTLSTWTDSELETATHSEKPWIEARNGLPASQKHNGIINKVTMRDFYKIEMLHAS